MTIRSEVITIFFVLDNGILMYYRNLNKYEIKENLLQASSDYIPFKNHYKNQLLNHFYDSIHEFALKTAYSKDQNKYIKRIQLLMVESTKMVIKNDFDSDYYYDLQNFFNLVAVNNDFSEHIRNLALQVQKQLKSAILAEYGKNTENYLPGIFAQFPESQGRVGYELRKSLYLSKQAPYWQKICEALAPN